MNLPIFVRGIGIALLLATLSCKPPLRPVLTSEPASAALVADLAFIGSEAQEGRAVGTAGSTRAAEYIAQRYRELGVPGVFPTACGKASATCEARYFQTFSSQNSRIGKNIGVLIAGTDASVSNQYVVVGAHYDHIGRSRTLSLDPQARDAIRPGADDNASGTVAIMELARRMSARPARRPILVVHFDAEELGLIGSNAFLSKPPVNRRQMKFMLNLDMVGRLSTGEFAADTMTMIFSDRALITLLDSAGRAMGVRTHFTKDIDGRSDHESFRIGGVPAIQLFTGFHDDYHRSTDVVSKVDVRGIRQIVDISEAIVRLEADRK